MKATLGVTASLVALAFFVFSVFYSSEGDAMSEQMPVLSVFEFKSMSQFDTANIRTYDEYNILENLFSPLFSSADNGEINGILAKQARWEKDELVITLREDIRTVLGTPITADDAAFTLKRLLVLGTNTHARLRDIFPDCAELSSPWDPCSGIVAEDSITLRLRPANEKIWLMETLTSQDFAIIPEKSVNRATLQIEDYSETSGPYFLESEKKGKGFVLRKNSNHPLIRENPRSPETVLFVSLPFSEAENLGREFLAGTFNMFPKYFIPSAFREKEILDEIDPSNLSRHQTELNFTRLLKFTSRGMRELSEIQRMELGRFFLGVYRKQFESKGIELKRAHSFYAPSADGALTPAQYQEVKQAQLKAAPKNPPSDLQIGILAGSLPVAEAALKFSSVSVELTAYEDIVSHVLSSNGQTKEPHVYLEAMDADPKAALSGVTNIVRSLYFHSSPEEASKWLKMFSQEKSKLERLKMLQEAHYRALKKGKIVPVYAQSTRSFIRKPWSLKRLTPRNMGDLVWPRNSGQLRLSNFIDQRWQVAK